MSTTKAILGYTDHDLKSPTWGRFIAIVPIPATTQDERDAARPIVASLGLEYAPIYKLDAEGDWIECDRLYA